LGKGSTGVRTFVERFFVKMVPRVPSRFCTDSARNWPSGENAAEEPKAARRRPVPSAFTTKTSPSSL
jgi:hypothetical protein